MSALKWRGKEQDMTGAINLFDAAVVLRQRKDTMEKILSEPLKTPVESQKFHVDLGLRDVVIADNPFANRTIGTAEGIDWLEPTTAAVLPFSAVRNRVVKPTSGT